EHAGSRRRLLDDDTHGEATDQTARPRRVVAHEPVPRPGCEHAFGLSHPRGDADQPVGAVGGYSKLHLPRVRLIVSGHPDKPLRVVHGLILSAYAISAQKPSPRLWCLTSVKQGRSILLCCPMPRIASSSLWDATSTTMPFTF